MLRPSDNSIDNKLLPLELSHSEETQEISVKEYKEVNYQSIYYTIFERELRQNVFKVDENQYGNIELTIVYDRYDKSDGIGYVSAFMLFMPSVVGFPLYTVNQYTEVEITINDTNNKLIKRYNYGKKLFRLIGFYYGHKYASPDNTRAEVFKDIIEEFKTDLAKDSMEINKILKLAD